VEPPTRLPPAPQLHREHAQLPPPPPSELLDAPPSVPRGGTRPPAEGPPAEAQALGPTGTRPPSTPPPPDDSSDPLDSIDSTLHASSDDDAERLATQAPESFDALGLVSEFADAPPPSVSTAPMDALVKEALDDGLAINETTDTPDEQRAQRLFVFVQPYGGRPQLQARFVNAPLFKAYWDCYLSHGIFFVSTSLAPPPGTRIDVFVTLPDEPEALWAPAIVEPAPPAIGQKGCVARVKDSNGAFFQRLSAFAKSARIESLDDLDLL